MIQEYKRHIRYWIATRFGDIDQYDGDTYEIICPDCNMTTPLYATDFGEQSCYFCDGSLKQKSDDEIPIEHETETPTAQKIAN